MNLCFSTQAKPLDLLVCFSSNNTVLLYRQKLFKAETNLLVKHWMRAQVLQQISIPSVPPRGTSAQQQQEPPSAVGLAQGRGKK